MLTEPEPQAKAVSDAKADGQWPFYPLLIAVFPVLSIYSANLSLIPLGHLFRPLAIALGLGAVIQVLASLVLRSRTRGAAASAALLSFFWLYSWLSSVLIRDSWFGLGFWLVILVVIAGVVLAAWWGPKARILNLVSACVVGVSALNLTWLLLNPPRPKVIPGEAEVSPLPAGPRPDVYHLVLDGFGSQESLKTKLGIDLAWFFDGLKERGFQVASHAKTNFVQTELSLSSSLNLDYIQALTKDISPDENDRRVLAPLLSKSLAVRRLQASGYRFAMVGTGFSALDFGRYRIPLNQGGGITLFEGTLLDRTPFPIKAAFNMSQFDEHRALIKSAFNWLVDMAPPAASPRFTFVHILGPHPPFVFGPEGESVRPKGPYGMWDGSDYLTWVGNRSEYEEGYKNKASYIGRRTLELIDALKAANPKNPPIIIIQGDHGSKLGLDQNSLEKTDLKESFSILYALHFPPASPIKVTDFESPVNTYRKVFRALGEKNLPDLANRSWYSTFPKPFALTEVTERLKQTSP